MNDDDEDVKEDEESDLLDLQDNCSISKNL